MIPCHIFLFILFNCSKRHVRLQFGSICTNTLPNQVHFFANHTHLPWLRFFVWLRSNVDVTKQKVKLLLRFTEILLKRTITNDKPSNILTVKPAYPTNYDLDQSPMKW